ncbi:MAG: phosphatase PAP2 family protein [Euryarchaeota archaeon]|nr:phosphatase PAP2 family protein [Euryarchaeota archaeon]
MEPPRLLLKPFKIFQSTWARRALFGGYWYIIEIIILGLLLVAIPYFSVNQYANSVGHTVWDPELPFDRAIPVISWMIVPYVSLYLLNPLPIITHPRNERARMELLLTLQAIGTLTIVSCIFFLLLPAEVDMRDQLPAEIMNGEGGIIGELFRMMHSADEPWNAWPSLHISQSFVLVMVMTRWLKREWSDYSWSRPALLILWTDVILLFISILTTKQHYVWDLATGLMMGYFWWWMLSAGFKRLDSMSDDDIAAEFTGDANE